MLFPLFEFSFWIIFKIFHFHGFSGDKLDVQVDRSKNDNYENYVECLTSYLQQNMQCIEKSYTEAPTEPTNPTVELMNLQGAKFSWQEPLELANTVTSYTVQIQWVFSLIKHLIENYYLFVSRHGDVIQKAVTNKLHYITGPLNSNTQYTVSVSASSKTGSSQNSAPLLFSTAGAKVSVEAVQKFHDVVQGGDVTMVCKISLPGNIHRPLRAVWLKSTPGLRVFTDVQRLYSTGNKLIMFYRKYWL